MAKKILILGRSGTGKSTAIRTLEPTETFIIKCTEKELPFKNSSKLYNKENKNCYTTNNISTVLAALKKINENKKIKTVVLDDFNYLMTYEYKAKADEIGFKKFEDIAFGIMNIFETIDNLRDDLIVYVISHTQTDQFGETSTKTIGKFLDDKLVIEGLFTTVLLSTSASNEYKFITNGLVPAKSPVDMFSEQYIANDLQLINTTIETFYN